jgi:hypothetical protein
MIEKREDPPLDPPKGKTSPKASRYLPEDFVVTDALRTWAAAEVPGIDIDYETKKMRDCEFPKPHADWVRTWRTWMRRAYDQGRARSPTCNGASPLFTNKKTAQNVAEAQRGVARLRRKYGLDTPEITYDPA